jgi:hypothetical protein
LVFSLYSGSPGKEGTAWCSTLPARFLNPHLIEYCRLRLACRPRSLPLQSVDVWCSRVPDSDIVYANLPDKVIWEQGPSGTHYRNPPFKEVIIP